MQFFIHNMSSLQACGPSTAMVVPTMPVRKKTKAFRRWKAGVIETLDAMPMTKVHVDLRVEANKLLHNGFGLIKPNTDIAEQLCLRAPLRVTRHGRTSARSTMKEAGTWLVWRKHGSELVGVAIVEHKPGYAPVLTYITAKPGSKAGHELVEKAGELVRNKLRCDQLYSPVDLNQQGQAWDNEAKKSAAKAHERWGFVAVQTAEWLRRCPRPYHGDIGVQYMKKELH